MGPRPVVQHLVQAPLAEAVVNPTLHPLLTLPPAPNQQALMPARLASVASQHLNRALNLVVALVHHRLLSKHQYVEIQLVTLNLHTSIK